MIVATREGVRIFGRSIATFFIWLVVYQVVFTLLVHVVVAIEANSTVFRVNSVIILASFGFIEIWYPLILLVSLPVLLIQSLRRRARFWAVLVLVLAVVAVLKIGIVLVDLSMSIGGSVISSVVLLALSAIHIWRSLEWPYH